MRPKRYPYSWEKVDLIFVTKKEMQFEVTKLQANISRLQGELYQLKTK